MSRPRLRVLFATLAAALVVGACSSAPHGGESEASADPELHGDDASAPTLTTSPSELTETPNPSTTKSRIDACLLGRWVQVSMREAYELEGERAVATGWTGRRLTFRRDGSEVVSYADATPVVASSAHHRLRNAYRGVSIYQVRTRGHRLIFDSVDHGEARIVQTYDGNRRTFEPGGTSASVRYTCTATRHTQRNGSYQATFRRMPGES